MFETTNQSLIVTSQHFITKRPIQKWSAAICDLVAN
jgi:hypothetical protein